MSFLFFFKTENNKLKSVNPGGCYEGDEIISTFTNKSKSADSLSSLEPSISLRARFSRKPREPFPLRLPYGWESFPIPIFSIRPTFLACDKGAFN